MSTCAVMLTRDNADIIEATVRHLLAHVDEVAVTDHRSVDGTREMLEGLPVLLGTLDSWPFPGDTEWTRLSVTAMERGHEWALVVDADEIWHPTSERGRIGDFLDALPPSCLIASALVFDYVPTAIDDPDEPNPVVRIGWRNRRPSTTKAAGRLRDGVSYARHTFRYSVRYPPTVRGLTVRHFSIRTADQLVSKVRGGLDSFGALGPGFDAGWAQWKGLTDDEIRARFRAEFWSPRPQGDSKLVYDPAPACE